MIGATLADGGLNPNTRERVVDGGVGHYALAVMIDGVLYGPSATGSGRYRIVEARAALAAASLRSLPASS